MKKSELRSLIRECISELGGIVTNKAVLIPETPFTQQKMTNDEEKEDRFSGKIIHKSENTLVLRPLNNIDMVMISGGTKWPAGHFNAKHIIDAYLHRGKIFVIVNNKSVPIRKWALFVPQRNDILPDNITKWQMFDKENKEVDVDSTLNMLHLDRSMFEK